ncbi:hypothetical protein [Pseudoxanthomonas winnipegensis]|uniref:hypothetical protein n=1 Tax=Pseudoxanthomonas winnipegensis TaxID=2480810 RepID=UPI0013EEE631|nr:hypothetical protein [Pseudoxanthomonas winnipegensis]
MAPAERIRIGSASSQTLRCGMPPTLREKKNLHMSITMISGRVDRADLEENRHSRERAKTASLACAAKAAGFPLWRERR